MQFRNWFEENEEGKPVDRPYYRIVNGIYGSAGKHTDNPLKHSLAPGSYWTPRWDAVLMMIGSTFKYYSTTRSLRDADDVWNTTVYQLNKAIMKDPPKDHQWAFSYRPDAGEQVLVRALEEPKIAVDPESGMKIENLSPKDPLFVALIYQGLSQQIENPVIDYKKNGVEAQYQGQHVYILWDYDDASINLVQPNEDQPWNYKVVLKITSYQQWQQVEKQLKYITKLDDQLLDGLEWFLMDMHRDAEAGKPKAQNWRWVG